MSTAYRAVHKASLLSGIGALVVVAGTGQADPLALTDEPLFLSSGVKPNIIMAVDDSGSMDSETLFLNNDGAVWWKTSDGTCPRGFVGCGTTGSADISEPGRPNFNHAGAADGTWKKYIYLFPIGTGTGLRVYEDDDNAHYAIPPLPQYAWTRSPEFNSAYFNPAVTYDPWQSYGGETFDDVPANAAPTDPTRGTTIFDLTSDRMSAGSYDSTTLCSAGPALTDNHQFRFFPGMMIPQGTCYRAEGTTAWQVAATDLTIAEGATESGTTLTTSATGDGLAVAIRYYPATFYLRTTTALPAGYNYNGSTLSGTGPNGETLAGYEIKSANFASTTSYQAAMQNFANWWTYYRKRHAATRGGIGSAFADINSTRVGTFRINNRVDVTMRDMDTTTDRDAFYSDVYGYVNSGGTPNREAVYHMGNQFNRTGTGRPITRACQKNFGILFTDGFSNNTTPAAVGNVDSGMPAPFGDSVSDTMADYATYFYANRLRTDLAAGRVTVPAACSATPADPRLDCNSNLHMSFFAVTLGTRGLIYDVNMAQTNDPFANPPTWPTTFQPRHPSAVDDLWHATLNTRGQMLNARTPKDVGTQLSAVLRSISERTSSASSASVNSGTISSDTRVYQARFNSAGWTGELLSFPVNADGTLVLSGPRVWNASDEIPAPGSRRIVTVNSDGAPAAFRWDVVAPATTALDAARKTELNDDPALLNYLRGDRSQEGSTAAQFRVRMDADGPNVLGDIVASAPLFVGRPPFRYSDTFEAAPYSSFAATARRGMVYAGANDGMLHGFDAETGDEVFAFIPSPVFSRLPNLASQNYGHQFFVDGPPSMGDVFFSNAWHTVLVGGLNKGGRGIYALDITNPTTLAAAETNPNSIVLWEFTAADDADLGLTYSQPTIGKLQDGRWAAIFGNGYNSPSGKAVLYVVDIRDGSLIRKFDTGTLTTPTGATWDNGLSTPSIVDRNGDRKVDYVYAGDLFGNMWKFDLSGAPATWGIAFSGQPLYQARDASGNAQPITVAPEVARGPFGSGTIVLFGTGKYLELTDRSITPEMPQTFYGIVDRNAPVSDRTSLQVQSITDEFFHDPDGSGPLTRIRARVTTNNPLGASSGWYLDLVSPSGYEAEKQVSNPIIRDGKIVFTTLIPDTDPCSSGGRSWLMELDALSGSRLAQAPFDLNRDGQFTDADRVMSPTPVHTSGVQWEDAGILQSPGVIEGETDGGGSSGGGVCVQYKYMPDSNGRIQMISENCGPGGMGRQSWRQLR